MTAELAVWIVVALAIRWWDCGRCSPAAAHRARTRGGRWRAGRWADSGLTTLRAAGES